MGEKRRRRRGWLRRKGKKGAENENKWLGERRNEKGVRTKKEGERWRKYWKKKELSQEKEKERGNNNQEWGNRDVVWRWREGRWRESKKTNQVGRKEMCNDQKS